MNSGPPSDKAASAQQLLETLWEKGLPLLRERLDVLDAAAKSSPLPDGLRREAAGVAHKLAGSLGMYGYGDGTRLARSLEVELEGGAGPATLKPLAAALRKTLNQ